MIRVRFDEPDDPAWKKWRDSSATAAEDLLEDYASGRPIKISQARYKKMKALIFAAFHGKCAYCESRFSVDQPGDVEHFRPKGDVVDERDQPVVENGKAHPGYFWLAYDWHNLFPSCRQCNSISRTPDGRLVGKGMRFPVLANRAWTPAAVAQEQPVFLNPLLDDPEQELDFDAETGIIFGRTERGKRFIELLDLNRDDLTRARRKTYVDVQAEADQAFGYLAVKAIPRALELLGYLQEYKVGSQPYSLAGRRALADLRNGVAPLLAILT